MTQVGKVSCFAGPDEYYLILNLTRYGEKHFVRARGIYWGVSYGERIYGLNLQVKYLGL